MLTSATRHCFLIALVILGAVLGAPGRAAAESDVAPVVATASRLAVEGDRTRFVLELDHPVDFEVFTLADPARIVVDLPETRFNLDDVAGREGRGLVTAYRFGLFAPGKSRIVIDASGPVRVENAHVAEAEGDQPARLVIDIVQSDRDSFLADIALQDRQHEAPARPSEAIGTTGALTPGKHVIVVDPGHGGIDPGAISPKGTREKDIVLAVAKQLKRDLERTGRFSVLMTRDDDIFIPLGDRVSYAREHQAALFISIHADSVRRGKVSGATVYTLSDRASDAMAAELAEQENKSDAIAGVEIPAESTAVADILLDLVRRETKTLSIHFARSLVDGLGRKVDMVSNPHRHAGFRVLKAHDVPSVLLELGYLSSDDDEKKLLDPDWQEEVASTVTRSVERFFGDRQARSPF